MAGGVPLSHLNWCQEANIRFEDDATTPTAILTTWDQAQAALGFAPLLPPALPSGSCLLAAGGTLHDPIFGGRFSITYRLASGAPLSIAEAQEAQPLPAIQCSANGATGSTIAITTCRQTQGGLDITISSTQPEAQTRALLAILQPKVAWVPLTTPTVTPGMPPGSH